MNYDGHFYLSGRNIGSTKKLVGRVVFASFFVDINHSCWKESEKRAYDRECKKAVKQLIKDAASRGVSLQIETCSYQVSLPSMQDFTKNPRETADQIVRGAGFPAMSDVYLRLRGYYKADEVAPIILLHTQGRSFAVPTNSHYNAYAAEFAMLYQTWLTSSTIIHELLHVFGAQDYYYPDYVKECAQKYLTDSIMYGGTKIDDLTAYVIGWKDTFTVQAENFLEATKHITAQTVYEATSNEWNGDREKNKALGRKPAKGKTSAGSGAASGKTAAGSGAASGKTAASSGTASGKAAASSGTTSGKTSTSSGSASGKTSTGSGSASGKTSASSGAASGKTSTSSGTSKGDRRTSCIPGVYLSHGFASWDLFENGKHRRFISNDLSFYAWKKRGSLTDFFKRLKAEMEKSLNRKVDFCVLAAALPSHKDVWSISNSANRAGLSVRILGASKAAVLGLFMRDAPRSGRAWTYGALLRDGNEIELCIAQMEDDLTEILSSYRRTLLPDEALTKDTLRMMLEIVLDGAAADLSSLDCLYYEKELEKPVHDLLPSAGLTGLPYTDELVVQGAAVQGAKLMGELKELLLLDNLSYDFQIPGSRETAVSINAYIPTRCVTEGFFRDLTDTHGHICISSRGYVTSSLRKPDIIQIPVYDLWDGKDQLQKAQVSISIDADLKTEVTVKNLQSQKTLKKKWTELYE